MPKQVGPEGLKVTLGAKVKPSVRARFEESAKRNGSNRSALGEILVEAWLESGSVREAVRRFMDEREASGESPPANRKAASTRGKSKAARE